MNILQKPSPNFLKGRNGYKPEILVIHCMDGTLVGTDDWFSKTVSQVSAHYGVGTMGEVHQYVQEADTAWHAGRVSNPTFALYKANVNPNSYTIGIEHEGNAMSGWSPEMKIASATLIRDICKRNAIPIDRDHIIGHYQIYSQKPNCPATNKGIIDELITLASPINKIDAAIALLEQALKMLKS